MNWLSEYRLSPTAIGTGERLASCADSFLGAALHGWAVIDPACDVRDDPGAALSVQVAATSGAYWADGWGRPLGWGPRMSLGMGFGRGWRGGAFGWGMGWPLDDPSVPVYVSEVSLLMRDLRTGQIVYDTRARHDGPWSDTDNILPALFAAALEGFPNPAQTERPVGVPLLPVAAGGLRCAEKEQPKPVHVLYAGQ